jgi:hypothetical protein
MATGFLFFEVMNDQGYKGEIAFATSADGLAWEYQGIVLAEPFSLSYPQVFRWRGEVYMVTMGAGSPPWTATTTPLIATELASEIPRPRPSPLPL